MRGGEKVLLSLARLFPGATIFTLLHVKGSVDAEIEQHEIRTSFLQHAPGVRERYRHYLPLFPAAAEAFDLRGFDLVLSSSHCVAKGVRPARHALHLCYCHTPMRYVWDRYADYFGPGRLGPLGRVVIPPACAGLRAWDAASAARVHRFVANSHYVAARIRRYYGRDAEVIEPPVDAEFYTPAGDDRPGEYDLVVSALAPYKRIGLALEAYRGTDRALRVVGTGPEESRLRAIAPPAVQFLGRVSDEELRELYRGCRAVLMPGIEDFGIVPLEAMACGRPAVVFGEGGGAETVEDGRTGLVFREPTAEALRAAVATLETTRFDRLALRRRAEQHRREAFEARIRAFVQKALDGSRNGLLASRTE
jgi:glycosyltransferase involved in cell wall biosynthesis